MVESREASANDAGSESAPPEAPAVAKMESAAPPMSLEAIHPSRQSSFNQESLNPMLDVHAPHGTVHTWKDFFIHIATIVIGLLIAIGLEQSVEWVHHKNQIREAREALSIERQSNRETFSRLASRWSLETAHFQSNLAVFQHLIQQPLTHTDERPAKVDWHILDATFSSSAWDTAKQSGITALMPQQEVRTTEDLYKSLSVVDASAAERLRSITSARRYMTADSDPSSLTAVQLSEEISLSEAVLAAQYRLGSDMRNLSRQAPDFSPAPTTEALLRLMHEPPLTIDEMHELGAPPSSSPR